MTIISSPIDINKIPSSISIIIAGALIAAGIVVEPFVTDRGRFQASPKAWNVVLDVYTQTVAFVFAPALQEGRPGGIYFSYLANQPRYHRRAVRIAFGSAVALLL
jgi:hypothetical protein